MLVLKRLDDARRDGDRIYAVIRSIGSSSDGKGQAVYAPAPQGRSRRSRQAYDLAGIAPATVELVEAHGTGTQGRRRDRAGGARRGLSGSGPTRARGVRLGRSNRRSGTPRPPPARPG